MASRFGVTAAGATPVERRGRDDKLTVNSLAGPDPMFNAVINYAIHLIASAILLGVFFVIYTKVTPYDEVALIRAGRSGAAWSLGGALVGFSLTLGSAIVHNATVIEVLMWAVAAMVVQILVFAVASRLLVSIRTDIEGGNVAMGGFLGTVSLVAGIVNAACLS